MTSVEYNPNTDPSQDLGEDPAEREANLRLVADSLDAAYWQRHIENQPTTE